MLESFDKLHIVLTPNNNTLEEMKNLDNLTHKCRCNKYENINKPN